ncbi:hypothetical protein WA026_003506 [Henosepilachna vigintioctopunctata]|uniref:Uncharacterized protein n=1 Tax=Henosepilachna vigintioctopunctata TaxID=420089 RepID=A0AAW1TRJ9_9CUCU
MGSLRMNFIALYICVHFIYVVESIAVPQYAYREIRDEQESIQKNTPIPILKQSYEQSNEGYQYSYETGNGIHAEESGYLKNKGDEKNEIFVQKGSITYHDEHGHPIKLTYVADEKGFRPQGDHLPISPIDKKETEENVEHEVQEHQKEPLHQEQEVEQEYVNNEKLKAAQREYQRQIQQQIEERFQHQYQQQQEAQEKPIYQSVREYQPPPQYQNQYQRKIYQRKSY